MSSSQGAPLPPGMDLKVREDGLAILRMSIGPKGGNLFDPDFTKALNEALTAVEEDPKIRALVITSGGKYFSNGLNTKFLKNNPLGSPGMVVGVYRVLARLLVLGFPTIAAINGHCFGAGFFLALCCDYRIMTTDQGLICLPELDLGMPLSPGFNAIAKCKLPKAALRTTVLTSKRWTPQEAFATGILDQLASGEQLLSRASTLAVDVMGDARKRKRHVYSMLKMEIYGECYETLTSWFILPRVVMTLIGMEMLRQSNIRSKM
ncbi:hypothetical protein AAMO2058_001686600 [Amorphochlora amoebiformis]